jgi:tetratricopeptide (TPR) repeat protein
MVHRRPAVFFALLIPFLQLSAFGQMQTGNVHVYVTYPDDRAPSWQMKVDLISGGNQVAETFTNDHGQAEFFSITLGNYHVVVSGEGIQKTDSEEFEVDARKGSQSVFVRVRPVAENRDQAGGATVSVGDLRVPKDASQEFDKATELIAKQQWQKAIDHLTKALSLYPGYVQAYTNLGVIYARLGQPDKEREALEKAIGLSDHFAPALINLAKLEMRLQNFVAAEADLKKAVAGSTIDGSSMVLLAQAQLLNLHYEDAIASARNVHDMFPGPHALVHYIAARACERLKRFPEAIRELKLYLSEAPSGAFTASAKQELAALEQLPPS